MNLDYLCGFMDGEGCISMNSSPMVSIAQTNEEVLKQIQALTGLGNICRLGDKEGRKTIWNYQVAGIESIQFLELIVSRLVLKKSQAEAVIEAKHLFPAKQGGKKLSKEMKEGREKLRQLLKDLKKT